MKHIQTFESFLNEAARVGRSSWNSILKDLKYEGWDIKSGSAYKSYADDNDEERELKLSSYGGDEVQWTLYDGSGDEIDSGSIDAEGLSAGELDSEVWNYLDSN